MTTTYNHAELLNPNLLDRTKTIALLGNEAAYKIPVHTLRPILAPLTAHALHTAKKKDLVELWATIGDAYRMTVSAVPSVADVQARDTITPTLVRNWLEAGDENVKYQFARSIQHLALTTQKRELTNFRRAVMAVGRDDLSDWSKEWGSSITRKVNEDYQRKVGTRLDTQIVIEVGILKDWVDRNLDTTDWKIASILLALCTGRRMIEVFARGCFTFHDSTFDFTGQAKTRGASDPNELRTYPLWHLTGEQASRLFQVLEPRRLEADCTERAVNTRYSSQLSKIGNKPPLPNARAKFKDMRDIYVALIIHQEQGSTIHPIKRSSYLLGQALELNGVSRNAYSYQDFKIIDSSLSMV